MSVIRKRSKWWVDICLPSGQRVRRVSPVQTRAGALAFEATLRGEDVSSTSMPSSTVEPTPSPEPMRVAPPPPTPSAPTLSAFACEWLTTYAVVNNKPSEVISKESNLRNHLLPFFDNRRLDEITTRDIERYKGCKLRGVGGTRAYKPKTVNNHLATLRTLLMTAMEWDLISSVPKIRLLKVPPQDFDWLTRSESKLFLAAVDEHHPQWRALFWLALRTGLRRGELFALQWKDVDLDPGAVHVRRGVFRGRLESPKGGRARTVPMTRRLVSVVASYKAKAEDKSTFLFPGADGKLTRYQDHVDRPHKGALKKARLRTSLRFHDLRHSFGSQLIAAGRSLKEVQELLGHASITTTMRYAHLAPDQMRDAVTALEDDE